MNRKDHWESIYKDKSPVDVSWYQKEPTLSLELIRNTQVSGDAPIIDVGGGASVLVDYLIKENYTNIAILDISGNALESAKSRLADNAQSIEWYESDITQFDALHQFSLWHDRAVFHFLTTETDRRKYVNVLKKSLTTGGSLIIAAFAMGGPEKCSGLDIEQYDAEKIVAELGEEFELVEQESEVHMTPANKAQKFMYFRFIREPNSMKT